MTLQKLRYESPVVELLQFEDEDIICTSGNLTNEDTDTSTDSSTWANWP